MLFTFLGAAIGAVGNITGNILNNTARRKENERSQNFAREQYNLQRGHSLSDWAMQNAYNHPSAQMQRFEQANLNPNLMYGQASSGNASAPRASSPQSAKFEPATFDGIASAGGIIGDYYDLEIKKAQSDNLRADNTVKTEQANLVRAQTANTTAQANTSKFNLDFESELRETSANARKESLRQAKSQTRLNLQQRELRAISNDQSVTESIERIARMRIQNNKDKASQKQINQIIANLKKDGQLKQIDIDLRNKGINPSDPTYIRVIGTFLEPLMDRFNKAIRINPLNNFFKN